MEETQDNIQEQNQEVNPPFFRRPPKWIVILSFIINALIIVGLFYYFLIAKSNNISEIPKNEDEVACTLEAMQCPDGSYVSRTGPNCEFSPCPGTSDTSSWKVYSSEKLGVSFKYPENFYLTENATSVTIKSDDKQYFIGTCNTFTFSVNTVKADLQTTPEFYEFKVDTKTGKRLDKKYELEGLSCTSSNIIFRDTDESKTIQISFGHKENQFAGISNQILSTFRFD